MLGVVGLYLHPSVNAVVVWERETSLTLAVENRSAMSEAESELSRTLSAAGNAGDEAVAAEARHRGQTLPQFVKQVGSRFPHGLLHVLIHASPQYSTAAELLPEQPRVRIHHNDQTREAWFLFVARLSELNHPQDPLTRPEDPFTSVHPDRAAILDWIAARTSKSRPFAWMAQGASPRASASETSSVRH